MSFVRSIIRRRGPGNSCFFGNDDDHDHVVNISRPTSFQHVVKVTFDKESNEFIGIPEEWRDFLVKNNMMYDLINQFISYFYLNGVIFNIHRNDKQAAIGAIRVYNKERSN